MTASLERFKGTRKGNGKKTIGKYEFDDIDRKIIGLLAINSGRTQTEIASHVGLSQSSIALRLLKLKKTSLLMEQSGLNFEILGMTMCRVDVETSVEEDLLEWARRCPLFINASNSIGGGTLSLFFTAEDNETFHEIIEAHLRRLSVKIMNISFIRSWERPLMLQFNLDNKDSVKPPCNIGPYCSKCPANPRYDGRIWNGAQFKKSGNR